MRIALISRSDGGGGGASRMAEVLAAELLVDGHEARHLTFWPRHAALPFQAPAGRGRHGVMRATQRVWARTGLGETGEWEHGPLRAHLRAFRPDLIHFHDLSCSVSPETVRRLAGEWPSVWTFHDCAAFTGGCLYPGSCTAFRSACGNCPQHGEWPLDLPRDLSARNLAARRRLFRERRIACTAPSRWLCDLAGTSGLLQDPVEQIVYGIDTKIHRPQPKADARAAIGIDPAAHWVLLSAAKLDEPRKGVREAVDVVARIRRAGISARLLIMGRDGESFRTRLTEMNIPFHRLGFVSDQARLASCYAAADLLLLCSHADNQPVAILEAMASGTPVAAYASGGIPEMIRHGVDGLLAQPGDVEGLACDLVTAYREGHLRAWAEAAPDPVRARHSLSEYRRNHLELYTRCIAGFTQCVE